MTIKLTPELSSFVDEKVKTGTFQSADDVIRESLRLWKEHDKRERDALEELRRQIQIGIDEADRGELEDMDDGFLDRVRGRNRTSPR